MSTVVPAVESPYLGLRYFDEDHAHLFFGRDAQVNDILEKLQGSRLVTVMGGSGSGKSSLVRAGVLPRLKAGLLADAGPRWRVVKMRPGSSPIASLCRELEKALSVDGLEVTLRRGALGLVQAVEECRLASNENVLIVADQFEELFRYQREAADQTAAKDEAAAFVKLLLEASGQRSTPIYVIVTMRSDYLGACAQFRDLPERINHGLYLVPRMRRDQLEQAITGPAAVEDARVAPRLCQKLLNETGDDPDQLPVLQHALLRTWSAWNGAPRSVDLEDLEGVGGMKDGLSRHANEIFATLSSQQQRIARVMFQQLSDRDAEGREVRRPVSLKVVAAIADVSEPAVDDVVAKFAAPDAALVYRNEDGDLDLTHESLIRKWDLIQGRGAGEGAVKGWMQAEIEARDEFLYVRERCEKGDALVGRALEEAISWRDLGLNVYWIKRYVKSGNADAVFRNLHWFIWNSQNEEMARRHRRRRVWWAVLAVAAAFAVMIALFLRSADEAARQARIAFAQLSTQEAARLVEARRAPLALAHLARAIRSAPDELPTRSWISSLLLGRRSWIAARLNLPVRSVVFSPDGRRIVTASGRVLRMWDAVTVQPSGPTMAVPEIVNSVAYSPDGRYLIAACDDGQARIWDAATGEAKMSPIRHAAEMRSAIFSPDGSRIVTAAGDNRAQIWELSRDRRGQIDFGSAKASAPLSLQHQEIVMSAVFSADGRRVLTASLDGTARVWDAITGKELRRWKHDSGVLSAAFSPGGQLIVTASLDKSALVWDANNSINPAARLQHNEPVLGAAFSPDGASVVTVSGDNTARMWEAGTGRPLGAPMEHEGLVNSAAFSPDGARVITGSDDGTMRVWDAQGHRPVKLEGQTVGFRKAVFSPNGRRIATFGTNSRIDNIVLWRPDDGLPAGTFGSDVHTTSLAFSGDGRLIATPALDSVRIWDATNGEPHVRLPQDGPVLDVSFSSDSRRLVSASRDGAARIWDVDSRRILSVFRHGFPIGVAAFAPDGRRVATVPEPRNDSIVGKPDNEVWLWDVGTGRVRTLSHPGRVRAVVFTLDGRQLLSVLDSQGPVQVWDVSSGTLIRALGESVSSLAISSDGTRVVTVYGGSAQIWDVANWQPVGVALQHNGSLTMAVFSRDGRRVATSAYDSTARVWDASTGRAIAEPLTDLPNVESVSFDHDGRRIVTTSEGGAYVWELLLGAGSPQDGPLLADLAEAIGGYRVTDSGSVIQLSEQERRERMERVGGPHAPGLIPTNDLLRPLLPQRQ